MKNWKNLLVLLIGLLLLCGCGSDSDSDSDSGGGSGGGSDVSTAELIESDDTGNASIPQIAMDTAGNVIAVWQQSDGTRTNIWANRFNGTVWGTAELIESDDTGDASIPQIAVAGAGNAIAVWQQSDGTRTNIWANRFDGTAWGTAELIESDDTGNASIPQIAMDTAGNAIAVWQQSDGTRTNIRANRFDGTTWGTAELIESDDNGAAWYPQIVVAGAGNAIAIWQQSDGTHINIRANRFDGTAWGTAELIESDDGDASIPQIAMDTAGNAIAVWQQSDGTHINIRANRFEVSTAWGTAELIESDDGSVLDYQIVVAGDGNAIAVWNRSDGTDANIWANRFDGTTWGTAELIESDDGNAWYPQIAMAGAGNAIAVWQQSDGTRANIWANRFDGTAWGTAELIESDDTGAAWYPQIAVAGAGNAIAVWQQFDGTRTNICATRLE